MAKETNHLWCLECPHCGYKDRDVNEIFSEIEQDIDEYECSNCGKVFQARKIAIFSYIGKSN